MSDLQRFLDAQADPDAGFDTARAEFERGGKESHWIWYVFPQLPLGSSPMARRYAIAGAAQAEEYVRHGVLRERLRELTGLVQAQLARGVKLQALMGSQIDSVKLVSSMTLFGAVAQRLAERGFEAARPLADAASAVLAAAARQGFPACERTRHALAMSPE